MPASPVGAEASVIHVAFLKRLGQVGQFAEIRIVAVFFTGEQSMKAVMEVIVPLGVQAEAAQFPGSDHPGIV